MAIFVSSRDFFLSPLKNIVTGDGQTLISQSISVLCRFLMQIHKKNIFSQTLIFIHIYI